MKCSDVYNMLTLLEGPSYWGDNTFMELFTQNILDKEGLKQ